MSQPTQMWYVPLVRNQQRRNDAQFQMRQFLFVKLPTTPSHSAVNVIERRPSICEPLIGIICMQALEGAENSPAPLLKMFFCLGILFACSFEEYISLHSLRSHLSLLSQIKQNNRYHNTFQEGQYKE